MNINKQVRKKLEQLVSKGAKEAGVVVLDSARQKAYVVAVSSEGKGPAVSLTLTDYDRYSVTLRNLQVSHNYALVEGDTEDYLRQRVAQIIDHITYLEEPLELLELDPEAGMAQLRSNLSRQTDKETIYWQALVQTQPHPTISLTRYRWTPDNRKREVFVYPATFATLGRMAQDLADSLIF